MTAEEKLREAVAQASEEQRSFLWVFNVVADEWEHQAPGEAPGEE